MIVLPHRCSFLFAFTLLLLSFCSYGGNHSPVNGSRIFIAMDSTGQKDHLKAYGVAFAALEEGVEVDWLLNYKGGSFAINYDKFIMDMCVARGVSYVIMNKDEYAKVTKRVLAKDFNGDVVKLEKAPKIAVYTPLNKEPWDDAVTLALNYAEIPFEKIYASDVLHGALANYDWLHIHHEDFTGRFGKFWFGFHVVDWYQNDVKTEDSIALVNGYKKVSLMELAVVEKIKDFVQGGGNMFAMCSATETFDIALAAKGIDICSTPFDGDPADPEAQDKLNFDNCLAFKNFIVNIDSSIYNQSTIDNGPSRRIDESQDFFSLSRFNAKVNPIPALLCQNHTRIIKGFCGQTTAFRSTTIKPEVLVLAENQSLKEAKYIHGELGSGTWTFYGGHDPEDYRHLVSARPTMLIEHPHSPGYRLILNNVLFNAAKSKNSETVMMSDTTKNGRQNKDKPNTDLVVSRVNLYPNPSANELIISVPGNTDNSAGSGNRFTIQLVEFINASGTTILRKNYDADIVNVSLADMAAGVYLVKVNGVYAGRIVKE